MPEHDGKIHEDIGYIKASVQGIHAELKQLNSRVTKNAEGLAKHDIFFGKVGIIISSAIFLLAAFIDNIWAWIKSHL